MPSMRTLDEQNESSFSLTARVKRDVRLLGKIASMVLAYFTTGRAIRRAYRDKARRGEVYYVDEA